MKKYSLLLILALVGAVALFASVSHSDDAAALYGKTYVYSTSGGGINWVLQNDVEVEEVGGLCEETTWSFDEGDYYICSVRETGFWKLKASYTRNDSLFMGWAQGTRIQQSTADEVDLYLWPYEHGGSNGGGDE